MCKRLGNKCDAGDWYTHNNDNLGTTHQDEQWPIETK